MLQPAAAFNDKPQDATMYDIRPEDTNILAVELPALIDLRRFALLYEREIVSGCSRTSRGI